MSKLILVVVAILAVELHAFVDLNEFMRYGIDAGDVDLGKSGQTQNLDDGSSKVLNLTEPFQFFGQVHRNLWVNINGAVSFNKPIDKYTPTCAALEDDMSMISPFWADVDIRRRGTVFFRQTNERAVLDKAHADVLAAFPNIADTDTELGIMKWALVATWVDVPFYDDKYCLEANKTNTFQLTLATDEIYSFAIFYYNKIEWTTGTASGADCSGIGGKPARAGFDNGKGIMDVLFGSCHEEIMGVGTRTLGLTPGKYVFRVDERNIIAPGSSTLSHIGRHTTEPSRAPTTTTSRPTTTNNFNEHFDHTKHTLDDLGNECARLCPGLIEHPALQDECFEMWKKLENLIDELKITKKNDELEQIEIEAEHIFRVLHRIQDDIA